MKTNLKWISLIFVVTVLFFWKITLTQQYSVLMQQEQANQAYAWYHFSSATFHQGILPLWDPYTHAGRTFVGGMETGLFYPPKLLLYSWPLSRSGLFSQQLFHRFYVLAHILASCFLFLLARELGLSPFPAFVASLCFSLAGFMSKLPWPDMLDSGIWLPLILLFLLRAMRAHGARRVALFSCLSGIALGMAILGGRIHIVIMDGAVVAGAAVYVACEKPRSRSRWIRSVVVLAVIGLFALCLGAIQLLPSIEYSPLAVRHIGADAPIPATSKIPYADLRDEFQARSLASLLFPTAFGGLVGGEGFTLYFGVMPLILAIFGIWQNWGDRWVRYLTVLALLAFCYSLGAYSLLHGLAYALVPFLWVARGAARFIYVAHFSLAILAGFGLQTLLSRVASPGVTGYVRALRWVLLAAVIALLVPALYGSPEVNDWVCLSFLLVISSSGLFIYLARAPLSLGARIALVSLILFDMNSFYWIVQNKARAQKSGADYLTILLRSRNMAEFLKNKPDLFRVHLELPGLLNIGDLYEVQTTEGTTATESADFLRFRSTVPRAYDYLNVRYVVRSKSSAEPGPVYTDDQWKVYENPSGYPRAWVVHQATSESSADRVFGLIQAPDFDGLNAAVVNEPLRVALEPKAPNSNEEVRFEQYRADRLEIVVRAASRGLLVLSEMHYPGWQATVDGAPAPIYKVNGLLRGVVVPGGQSRIVMRYAPRSVFVGAVLTGLALLGALVLAAACWVGEKRDRVH